MPASTVAGARSVATSGSGTRSAAHLSTAASAAHLGQRKITDRKPAVGSAPVEPMGDLERLQHIRHATTKIEHTLETFRHVGDLDPLDVSAGSSSVQGVSPFLAKVHATLQGWVPSGAPSAKRGKKAIAAGPTDLKERAAAARDLLAEAEAVLKALPPSPVTSGATDGVVHSDTVNGEIEYPGLKAQLLGSVRAELRELVTLFESGSAGQPRLPSRRADAQRLLEESIAHCVDDVNGIFSRHLPAYFSECQNEGICYSAHVTDESADSRADRAPLVGVYVIDMLVGMSPLRSARIGLHHLSKLIELLGQRVRDEQTVLTAIIENAPSQPPAKVAEAQQQLPAIEEVLSAVAQAKAWHSDLVAEWASKEQRFLDEAIAGASQDVLKQAKAIEEANVIAAAQECADQLRYVGLPFLCPQYCRRRGITYSNPCSLRIGIRFYDPRSAAFLALGNLNPATVNNDKVTPIAQELLPSADELWLDFDRFPEVVKGERCVLRGVSEEDNFRCLEEQREAGGYFVINGGERICRNLMMQRSNVPLNIHRDRFADAGPGFSAKAVVVRSRRPSSISGVNYFYASTTGEVVLSFARRLVWHLPVPLLMRACKTTSLRAIYETLAIDVEDSDEFARIEAMLQTYRAKPYADANDMVENLAVLGRMYRQYQQGSSVISFIPDLTPKSRPQHDAWYGLFMLRRHLLPHLNFNAPTPDCPIEAPIDPAWPGADIRAELESKFHALIQITRQLFGFVGGASDHQGNDAPAFQEVFGASALLVGAVETCLTTFCKSAAYRLAATMTGNFFQAFAAAPMDPAVRQRIKGYVQHATARSSEGLASLTKLLTTGNFKVDRDEDFFLPQNSGWIVMAEHLNFFRFFEILRTLHRGKKISDMRSSEVRKFPSEAFGFLCMVHSPDGEDCGIVNFMSISTVITAPADEANARMKLFQLADSKYGLTKLTDPITNRRGRVPLMVEGALLGFLAPADAAQLAVDLRAKKRYLDEDGPRLLKGKNASMYHTEVVYVKPGERSPAGLFVFTGATRMMRPVRDLRTGRLQMVGSWEQIWLDVAAVPSDLVDARRDIQRKYELIEQNGSNIVSLTSNTIPFFEHNCSPRNLFQCGLSKQSCGTQLQSAHWRREAKLFRTITPQRYLVRTTTMDEYGLDDFSLGVNAVVAVLAYTGYDMDDAVIINRSAVDRGFLHAIITVAKVVDLKASVACQPGEAVVFHNLEGAERLNAELGEDGLPPKRSPYGITKFDRDHSHPSIVNASAVYSYAVRKTTIDPETRKPRYTYAKHHVKRWRDFDKGENAWIHNVVPLEYDGPDVTKALLVFRIPRSPLVGDKFSSRHGQKGTLPLHIKSHELPFTSRGMVPDVIINPHAFPSRMTVGMILEMVAGKMCAVQGRFFDNSPWSVVDEDPISAERLGEGLVKAGFARYGREMLYCGNTGAPMEADVFFGVCGYQRLRHQVSDKWQSRARTDATHRAVTKTGQPVKGRKRHGGVRVGEMERDGLLSHGIAEVVQDRLLHVSDKTKAFVCTRCGSMVGIYEKHTARFQTVKECGYCGGEGQSGNEHVQLIDIPQVLRLWAAELTGVGVRVAFKIDAGA